MKIVHLCLNGPFTEGWGYQENLLAKYHALAGHEVTVIAGQESHLPSGRIVQVPCGEKTIENGVRLIRVPKNPKGLSFVRKIFARHDVLPLLQKIQPDLVMIHGMVGDVSALQVKRYVGMGASACVVVDIHQDMYNTVFPKNAVKKWILRTLQRMMNGRMYPIYKKIYYTRPCRKVMAQEYYKAPVEKLSFLPMGCDPEEILNIKDRQQVRQSVRKQYGLGDEDIVICHGGKLEPGKKTVELIKAVHALRASCKNIKLLLFGAATEEYTNEISRAIGNIGESIQMLGYQTQSEYHRLFIASDVAVFPGTHSVLWEQAVASGLALVVNLSHGENSYLDLGGNVQFIEEGNEQEIKNALEQILAHNQYLHMRHVAETHGFEFFSYQSIAQRVIDEAMQ